MCFNLSGQNNDLTKDHITANYFIKSKKTMEADSVYLRGFGYVSGYILKKLAHDTMYAHLLAYDHHDSLIIDGSGLIKIGIQKLGIDTNKILTKWDTLLIHNQLQSWVNSLAKTIDATDTTYWGKKSGKNYWTGSNSGININGNKISLGDSTNSIQDNIFIDPLVSSSSYFFLGNYKLWEDIKFSTKKLELFGLKSNGYGNGITIDSSNLFIDSHYDSSRVSFSKDQSTLNSGIYAKSTELYFYNNLGIKKSLSQLASAGLSTLTISATNLTGNLSATNSFVTLSATSNKSGTTFQWFYESSIFSYDSVTNATDAGLYTVVATNSGQTATNYVNVLLLNLEADYGLNLIVSEYIDSVELDSAKIVNGTITKIITGVPNYCIIIDKIIIKKKWITGMTNYDATGGISGFITISANSQAIGATYGEDFVYFMSTEEIDDLLIHNSDRSTELKSNLISKDININTAYITASSGSHPKLMYYIYYKRLRL